MVVILLAVVVSACKKTENVGLDLVANPDNALDVGFNDSYKLTTYSTIVDSLASRSISRYILGSMVDPVFGTTTSGIYSQVIPTNTNIDFGDNPVCDSIVLSLDYVSFYGDSNATQRIMVYEIDESFLDSAYYSNSTIAYKSTPIFDEDVIFNLEDSIMIDDEMVVPHLRLTLDKSFGDNIVDKSGMVELSSDEEFLLFMKGLHITAQQSMFGGGHASFDLSSVVTSLTLYYHNDADTTNERFTLEGDDVIKFQNYNHHDYAGASIDLQNQLNEIDTASGQQEFYLQGMAGSRAFIRIEELDTIVNNGPIAVQMAELEFNVSNYSSTYEAPTYLTLIGVTSEGKDVFLKESNAGSTSIGGIFDDTKKQYVFNITRTIQEMFLGESDIVAFRAIITGEVIMPNRLTFGGIDAADGIRLKVYYTKVK